MRKTNTHYSLLRSDAPLLRNLALGAGSAVARRPGKNEADAADGVSERLQLARELHDGLLQSLTAAVLQLEVMSRLVDDDPKVLCQRLLDIQEMIVEQQRELRAWIENARHRVPAPVNQHFDLTASLKKLTCRVARWGPRVELIESHLDMIPPGLLAQVYRIVEESLSNITRHARARVAHVDVTSSENEVRITIEDDGCGFPFHGKYDLATLNTRRLGPVSLKDRIASLNGDLVLTSTLSGSRLEIGIPFAHADNALAATTLRRQSTIP